jgi:DNA-3-methyladenine glycosylase II
MALLSTRKDNGRGDVSPLCNAACHHLAATDPVLGTLIARVGPCTLRPRHQHFLTLCDSIISQQLSTRVAEVIYDRFVSLYPSRRPTPSTVTATTLDRLRTVGLSIQKAAYLKDLASAFLDGRVQAQRFARFSDEVIIEELLSVHGVGRWTAEMFLIFALNRPNVLPVDDLGIRKAIQRWYGFGTLPSARTIRRVGRPWHPYETIASWYLWQSLRLEPAE